MRRLGCVSAPLSGKSITENMELIKKAGFDSTYIFDDGTENRIDTEKCVNKAKEINLDIEYTIAPFYDVNSIWLEGDGGDAYTEKIRRVIQTSAKYGIPTVVLHTSIGLDVPKTSPIGLLRYKKLIIEAEKRGIRLAFKNTEIIRHLGLLLEYFKSENVGYCYDCGHERCFTPGFRFMKLFGDRTFCTHLHDNFGLAESKDINYRDDLHRIPFDCDLDFDRVCGDIRESGFNGTLMLGVTNRETYGFYDRITPEEFYKKAYTAVLKLRELTEREEDNNE